MIQQLTDFVSAHKGTIAALTAWFVHVNFPYLRDNGGVVGVWKIFLYGKELPLKTGNLETSAPSGLSPGSGVEAQKQQTK